MHENILMVVAPLRNRIRRLLNVIVTQGVTPHKLALTISLGIAIGILPLVWGATLLCVLIAAVLRLNQAGIQAVNYLSFPLQIALLIPFHQAGARLFHGVLPGPSAQLVAGVKGNVISEIALLAMTSFRAVCVWLIVAPLLAIPLYLILLPVFNRMLTKRCLAGSDGALQ